MKISNLIEELKAIRKLHGDLDVCISEPAEYWGSVHSHLEKENVKVSNYTQPEGPKSGKWGKGLIFER